MQRLLRTRESFDSAINHTHSDDVMLNVKHILLADSCPLACVHCRIDYIKIPPMPTNRVHAYVLSALVDSIIRVLLWESWLFTCALQWPWGCVSCCPLGYWSRMAALRSTWPLMTFFVASHLVSCSHKVCSDWSVCSVRGMEEDFILGRVGVLQVMKYFIHACWKGHLFIHRGCVWF